MNVVWFKVDDRLAMHPKAMRAGNKAMGLWVRAGAWSCQNLTDGKIPADIVGSLGGTEADARALVDAGLWRTVPKEGGWTFHDWATYQPTRASVERRRAQHAKRVKRWRAGKKAEQPDEPIPELEPPEDELGPDDADEEPSF